MKKRVLAVGKLLLGPLLLLFLLRLVGVDQLLATTRQARAEFLLLALLAYLGTVALRGLRWQRLLQAQGIRLPLPRLVRLDLVGSFFNLVLPSSVGGDVVKFYELTRDQSAREARIASSLLADRICGLVVLLLLGSAALPFAAGHVDSRTAFLILAATGGAVGAVALLLNGRLRSWGLRHLPGLAWLLRRRGIEGLYRSLDGYRGAPLAHAALASLLFNLLMIGVNVALGLAFHLELPLSLYAVVVPLISLVQAIPLSINGVGVREGGYLFFLGAAGVAPALALSMGLAYYGCTVAAGLLGALLYVGDSLLDLGRSRSAPTLEGGSS